jgi:hypothetical protein
MTNHDALLGRLEQAVSIGVSHPHFAHIAGACWEAAAAIREQAKEIERLTRRAPLEHDIAVRGMTCHHFDHAAPDMAAQRIVHQCPLCEIDALNRIIESWKREEAEWKAENDALREQLEAARAEIDMYASGDILKAALADADYFRNERDLLIVAIRRIDEVARSGLDHAHPRNGSTMSAIVFATTTALSRDAAIAAGGGA